jgi:hypothetical protein
MAGILGQGGQPGNRYNLAFDNTEPGVNPGRARRCNRGPMPQSPLPTGDRPGGKARQRDDPKARRRVETIMEACGQGFAAAFGKTSPRSPFAFGESDAFV